MAVCSVLLLWSVIIIINRNHSGQFNYFNVYLFCKCNVQWTHSLFSACILLANPIVHNVKEWMNELWCRGAKNQTWDDHDESPIYE